LNIKDLFKKPFLSNSKQEGAFLFEGSSKEIGQKIERVVGEFLSKKSFEILEYNYSVPQGEIDIVAKENQQVVFIEVKASHEKTHSYFPEEKVSASKIKKLALAADSWLQQHPEIDNCRFDVISVIYHPQKGVKDLHHFKDAIEL
jgi:putative endonuclease